MNFALIGAAGFVAPRHMKAIKAVGGNLVAALDPHDSVGILDSHFPECRFFTEFERFDRYCDKLIRQGTPIDWVSICSPNYLHDAHCRFALRIGANALCEKPLVAVERNLDALKALEAETGRFVYTVLQLRAHPEAQRAKGLFSGEKAQPNHSVSIDYLTPRGHWYLSSWKGDVVKSGGLAANIGVHLFDLATWLFGQHCRVEVEYSSPDCVRGTLTLKRAFVKWYLSIKMGHEPRRVFEVDGEQFDFTNGFADLHTEVYKRTLAGQGWGIDATREAIRITEEIRGKG